MQKLILLINKKRANFAYSITKKKNKVVVKIKTKRFFVLTIN